MRRLSRFCLRRCVCLVAALLFAFATVGCARESATSFGPPGPQLEVAAQTMRFGFEGTVIDEPRKVGAFSISTHPVTVGEYRKCVAAARCLPPMSSAAICRSTNDVPVFAATYKEGAPAEDLPVTCVSASQGRQYCNWQGGTLPTPDEWLLAARGPSRSRYAWGSAEPTCETHALRGCEGVPAELFLVGKHPKGASPMGMQDVLLTPDELIGGQSDAVIPACRGEACVVTSRAPGAIDMMVRFTPQSEEARTRVYGFRCAWRDGR